MSQAIQEANGVSLTVQGGGVSLYFSPNAILYVSDAVYNSTAVQDALTATTIIDADEVEAPPPSPIPHQFNNLFPVASYGTPTATELKIRFRESLGGFEDSDGNLYASGSTFITFRVEMVDENGNFLLWEGLRGADPGDGSVVLTLTNNENFKSGLSYPGTLGSGGGEYDLTGTSVSDIIIVAEVSGGGGGVGNMENIVTVAKSGGEFTLIQDGIDAASPSVHNGTAQAGGNNTITLASGASAVNDFYNGMKVRLDGGTGDGQIRTITDYVGSTKVATVDSNWSVNPDATSTYDVNSIVTVLVFPGEHDEAITLKDCVDIVALDRISTRILQQVTDNNVPVYCRLDITMDVAISILNANSDVLVDGLLYTIGTALVGGDISGNARGASAIDIQSTRSDAADVASGLNSLAIGVANEASQTQSTAIGYNNTASQINTTAIGSGNTASALNATAIGYSNIASGGQTTAVGRGNTASATYTSAFGYKAEARIQKTTNICGPQINRKDDGEAANVAFESFCGVQVVLMTKEVDLEAVADQTITLPSGCKFWVDEIGLIATNIDTLTVQPTIRFGITGTLAKQNAAAITTDITATGKREIEVPLVPEDGETSLTAGVTVGATATTALGRFYFKGLLIEDE